MNPLAPWDEGYPGQRTPITADEWHQAWNTRKEIDVPGRNGRAQTLHITRLVRTRYINGLPLDFLVTANRVREYEGIDFGISFAKTEPPADVYPLPVLWMQEGGDWNGIWIRCKRFLA